MNTRANPTLFAMVLILSLAPGVPALAEAPTPPDWSYQGGSALAGLGDSVVGAGDINGDGFDDVVVSAFGYDGAFRDQGLVLVFYGSPTGPGSAPDWTMTGDGERKFLGVAHHTGDINGDGYDDLLLSNRRLYFGSPAGLDPSYQEVAIASGRAVDWNGDGYGDLYTYAGEIWFGSPNGLDPNPVETVFVVGAHGPPALGDFTGDGLGDLVFGTLRYGPLDDQNKNKPNPYLSLSTLRMFTGSKHGLRKGHIPKFEIYDTILLLAAAGDVNGDGREDMLLGLTWLEPSRPRIYEVAILNYGAPNGLKRRGAHVHTTGDDPLISMGGAGDLNGDGFADVLVVDESIGQRRVVLYAGSPEGPAGSPGILWGEEIGPTNDAFGESVDSAGDVNGDGFEDLIVGSPLFTDGENGEGRAAIFLGSESLVPIPATARQQEPVTGLIRPGYRQVQENP